MHKTEVRLGFSPLVDATLLIVAHALNYYQDEGIEVVLSREANWSNIRDKLAYGLIDAAHVLAPMPLAARMGLGASMGKIIAPMALGLNGNSVVVSKALKDRLGHFNDQGKSVMGSALILAREVSLRRRENMGPVTLATPYAYSTHSFVLRHWVNTSGLDAERDVQWVVLPPSRMADMLASGVIDGFCSGAPWPQTAQEQGKGDILFSDPDYWSLKPEKILGVREDWANQNPDALLALMRALMKAGQWASRAQNRAQLISILSQKDYVNAPASAIELSLSSDSQLGGSGIIFDPQISSFPWLSHAKWFLAQMVKWNMIASSHDFAALSAEIYRPDLWRQAASSLGLNLPISDTKDEGGQLLDWPLKAEPELITMPPNRLFDGGRFKS